MNILHEMNKHFQKGKWFRFEKGKYLSDGFTKRLKKVDDERVAMWSGMCDNISRITVDGKVVYERDV